MLYIALHEGFFVPGSLPATCHNPGALVYAGQAAARPGPLGFACFPGDPDGWSALRRDIRAKLKRGIPLKRAWTYLLVANSEIESQQDQ